MTRASILLAAFLCGSCLSQAARQPNIILIYTDDHGWPDIGAAGINRDIRTPHLDRLAADGVYARSGYSTAPQCVPSRAGLLSGKSQNRFGVESNGDGLEGFDAELTIAERLKKAGYVTGQIGKWHLGPTDKITDHGFDDVYSKNANRPCHANYNLDGETIPMRMVDDKLFHLDACSRAAKVFIERHRQSPFFLYLAYRAPHVPLDAPQKYLSRFPGKMPERRRQALAMISAMDDGVGLIRETLAAHGLEKDTLLFYIGDNGAPLKIHKLDAPGGGPGWDGSLNEPMNGEKGMLSEGGMRVPFVVAWPGTIPGGQVYEHPVISMDVAATSVSLAGLPSDKTLDGVNLVPFLTGEKRGAPHDSLQWRWISQAAIREGDWKFLKGGKREYLYNLRNDREEKSNLLLSEPQIAARLRARLSKWADEMNPPGLATGPMSETWEQYYDYYLDGKAAAPLREKFLPSDKDGSVPATQGWIARNADLSLRDGALRVEAGKGKGKPFLVLSKVSLQGPLIGTLQFSSGQAGAVGFAWRLEGQKDFVADQISTVNVPASDGVREQTIELPASGKIIHLRLHLPAGESSVREISFTDKNGKRVRGWKFAK
ncbi:MAG: sulfatase-like hydrolase/transferase [Verrucomicrobiae bacterium]|nr:sulfatase-like hydrolase/transferase [Verrucomicrobiae bacterium]